MEQGSGGGEIAIFEAETGEIRVQVEDESVWLSQRQMAEVFDTSTDNISLHLKNIFADGEMTEESTTEDFSVVRQEGQRQVRRRVRHYNLDAILAVGYRVSSGRAIQFRKWATQVLREHLTRGYTINRQRFEKNARELEAALQLVRKAAVATALDAQAGQGLVEILSHYTRTFLWLQRYDEGLLQEPSGQAGGALPTPYERQQAGDPGVVRPAQGHSGRGTDQPRGLKAWSKGAGQAKSPSSKLKPERSGSRFKRGAGHQSGLTHRRPAKRAKSLSEE
jgi:prophage antirepressor-like protein